MSTKSQYMKLGPLLIALLITCSWAIPVLAEESVKFGIFPYLSPQKLVKLHKPLKDYLAQNLKCPIVFASAPDFKTFIERTKTQDYDLILTAPHMGRLAEKQSGYQKVAHSSNLSFAVFAVWKDSKFHSIKDIIGQKIILPPQKAIIHHLALNHMRELNIDVQQDVHIVVAKSHNSARQALLQKETRVAVFGKPTWDNCVPEDKAKLRILGTSEMIPGFMFMAHPSWKQNKLSKLQELILNFATTPAGQQYFAASGLKTFIKTDDEIMLALDPYVEAIFNQ